MLYVSRLHVVREVSRLLDELGSSEDEVANYLERLGVRGKPRETRNCAIAVYLGAIVGTEPRVSSVAVMNNVALIRFKRGRAYWLDLPWVICNFINRFDHRAYPSLETAPTSLVTTSAE